MVTPPLQHWLDRRRRLRRLVLAAGLLAMIMLGLMVSGGWHHRGVADARQEGRVIGVTVDHGVMLVIEMGGRAESIRMAGVVATDRWQNDARDWLSLTCLHQRVTLVRPRLEVMLVKNAGWWIYTEDGRLLNEWMIDAGYARADTTAVHDFSEWFMRIEHWAAGQKRGLWAME